jgi:alkanesulfonate monooxygenase SsuD/methylene tetrahydromethanopterin reductase-like flavin-dependent oxidoreductase (luciferase family)
MAFQQRFPKPGTGRLSARRLAARTADVVFLVVQDIDEVRSQCAALKAQLPAYGRHPDGVTVLHGVMSVVGRTEREVFDKLTELQSLVSKSNALALLSDRFGST